MPILSLKRDFWRLTPLQITLLDQAVVSGVNFLTGLLFARWFGLEEFGIFSLLWMVILFIGSVQTALIISPMMSVGPKQEPADEPAYYGCVAIHQLIFSVISTLLLLAGIAVAEWLQPAWHLAPLMPALGFASLMTQLQEFLRRYFFTRQKPGQALLNDVISYLGQLVLLIGFYQQAGLTLDGLFWIIGLTSALATCQGLLCLGAVRFEPGLFKRVTSRQFATGRWLLAATIVQWLSGNYILIAAGAMLGAAAVGVLKACQNILAISHILFNGLGNHVPSRAGKLLRAGGLPAMERYMLKITLFGGFLTLFLALPALLMPQLALKWVYGKIPPGAELVLMVYAVVYLVLFLNQMATLALRTLEETRPILVGYSLTSALSLLAGTWMIGRFGFQAVVPALFLLALLNLLVLLVGYRFKRKEFYPAVGHG